MAQRGRWLFLFSLVFAPAVTAGADKAVEPPDREMLRMIDFLKDMEVIKNLDMMKDMRQLEQMRDQAARDPGQAGPAKRKEAAK